MLAIATVDPRESRGSNQRRQATTEHPEHTEVRKPEEEQPRNTQNTRKSGKRGREATTEHTEHTDVRKARKRGNRGKGGGDRWKEEECRAAVAEEAWERMERGEGLGWKNKKPPLGNPRGGFKNPAIPTFALVCTIIGSESLTTVFGMGTGDPF